jgi:hypothetical protein
MVTLKCLILQSARPPRPNICADRHAQDQRRPGCLGCSPLPGSTRRLCLPKPSWWAGGGFWGPGCYLSTWWNVLDLKQLLRVGETVLHVPFSRQGPALDLGTSGVVGECVWLKPQRLLPPSEGDSASGRGRIHKEDSGRDQSHTQSPCSLRFLLWTLM